MSGPLLDRIDLHVEVDPVQAADLALPPRAASAPMRNSKATRSKSTNAGRPGRKLLLQAAEAMRLSVRGYTRMLRVARTISDLAGAGEVGRIHVAEALSYRRQAPRA